MKAKKRNSSKTQRTAPERNDERSIFARMMDLRAEIHSVCGLEPIPFWKRQQTTPEWTKNICVKFRNTILKSVLKLRPKQNKVDWRNYGRTIGCLERYKTFVLKDIPRICEEDGWNKLTDAQWKKIEARLGWKEAREYFLKVLKRPADDTISDEDLCREIFNRQLEHNEQIKQVAMGHVAVQDAKTSGLFWKGVSEGYVAFMNTDGEFSGDDRRFDVYSDLLAIQYEIEKMRRTLPLKSRNDLRAELKKIPDFKDRGQKWFNDVCDEIKLPIKGVGRAHKFAKP